MVWIEIHLRTGDFLPVAAVLDRSGVFAWHESPGLDAGWTLTHVPTGGAVAEGLRSRAAAARLAKRLLKIVPVERWKAVTDARGFASWVAEGAAIKAAVTEVPRAGRKRREARAAERRTG